MKLCECGCGKPAPISKQTNLKRGLVKGQPCRRIKSHNINGKIVCRVLRSGDPIPAGEPRRYMTSHGYVELRWLIGTNTLVRVYEHRLVAGLPASKFDVHHINGIKTDNRPENLQVLSRTNHRQLNVTFDVDAAMVAYQDGASLLRLSRSIGIDTSRIFRALRGRGFVFRTQREAWKQRRVVSQ